MPQHYPRRTPFLRLLSLSLKPPPPVLLPHRWRRSRGILSIGCLLCLSLTSCSVLEYLTTEPGSDLEKPDSRAPNTTSEARLRSDLVSTARQYIGTRYRAAGTSPSKGFDCSGFTQYVFDTEDIRLPRVSGDQAKTGRSIPLRDVQPGDLIFFQRSRTGRVFHVSLVVANNRNELRVVHATTSRGVIEEDINRSEYWQSMVAKARRVIN